MLIIALAAIVTLALVGAALALTIAGREPSDTLGELELEPPAVRLLERDEFGFSEWI